MRTTARHEGPTRRRGLPPGLPRLGALVVLGVLLTGALIWQTRDGGDAPFPPPAPEDPGPLHVHGLGVNSADGALFIATHTGLYRVADGRQTAERVGDRYQDTMGFAIVGPDRFLGSGHPDVNEAREQGLPPLLGLIESTDAGESWKPISLTGETDFHVLRFAGPQRLYGYDASNDRLLGSADGGRRWEELAKPGPIVDLAVAPLTPGRVVVTSAGGRDAGLFESRDGGRSWKQLGGTVGLLAWPAADQLYLAAANGEVFVSLDGGRTFEHRGEVGGESAAMVAEGSGELYLALHDGTVKRSADGGVTWTVRSRP